MRSPLLRFCWPVALCALSLLVTAASAPDPIASVLDTPAMQSPLAVRSPIHAIAWAGDHAIGVGVRGHVLRSEGATWRQMQVPTSSDLTSVHFVSATTGWAVGHGGMVLKTVDGGLNWTVQLDGRRAAQRMIELYQQRTQAGDTAFNAALAEAQRYAQEGPGRPFLGVWFADENQGFAVGAFNLIFHTRDGGNHWEPWFHRVDNPSLGHLYAVTGDRQDVYIVGEQGLVLKLSADRQRFQAVPLNYKGSLFGALIPAPGKLLVYGLRGTVRFTEDAGAQWREIESHEAAAFTGGAVLGRGSAVLVSHSGRVFRFADAANELRELNVQRPLAYSAVAIAEDGRWALAGMQGAQLEQPEDKR